MMIAPDAANMPEGGARVLARPFALRDRDHRQLPTAHAGTHQLSFYRGLNREMAEPLRFKCEQN